MSFFKMSVLWFLRTVQPTCPWHAHMAPRETYKYNKPAKLEAAPSAAPPPHPQTNTHKQPHQTTQNKNKYEKCIKTALCSQHFLRNCNMFKNNAFLISLMCTRSELLEES